MIEPAEEPNSPDAPSLVVRLVAFNASSMDSNWAS